MLDVVTDAVVLVMLLCHCSKMTSQLVLTLQAYVHAHYLLTQDQLEECRVRNKVRGRGREGETQVMHIGCTSSYSLLHFAFTGPWSLSSSSLF